MKSSTLITLTATGLLLAAGRSFAAEEHAHVDIAPFFENSTLLTGGLDHAGVSYAPPVRVYGYEFGEDPFDPFNIADPGINQAAGIGQLPAGAPLRYNILSNLRYWDGSGSPTLADPLGSTYLVLNMNAAARTLTATSGPQDGSLIQSIASDGSVHRHFVTSLFNAPGDSNIPGDIAYIEPAPGIYAFSLELTLTHNDTTYTSDPVWLVFNNGLDETLHDAALDYVAISLIPEPTGLAILALAAPLLQRRRTDGRQLDC